MRLLAAVAGLRPTSLSETRSLLLSRIRFHVLAQLSDQTLSVATVAAAFGMTSRAVSALFADNGATLSRYVWAQRLERCRKALQEPALAGRSITAIAFANGFSDFAHFSRALRRRYGASPREWRQGPRG